MHPTKAVFLERGDHTLAFQVSIDHPEPWEHQGPIGAMHTAILECDPDLHMRWIQLMIEFEAAMTKAMKQGRSV